MTRTDPTPNRLRNSWCPVPPKKLQPRRRMDIVDLIEYSSSIKSLHFFRNVVQASVFFFSGCV